MKPPDECSRACPNLLSHSAEVHAVIETFLASVSVINIHWTGN